MARFGYDKSKCDQLRLEAKRLRDRLYRKRQVLKKSISSPKTTAKIQRDIDQLKDKIGKKKSSIWKCSEQYLSLKKQQRSDYDKIRYRESRLSELEKESPKAKAFRKEIKDIRSRKEQISEKLFYGSDRYQNMGVNMDKLARRIKYLQKRFVQLKQQSASGEVDKNGKKIVFSSSQRMKLITEIKELGEKREALEEAITHKKIQYIDHDRVEFFADRENLIDYSEETIFSYKDELDRSIRSGRYSEVKIMGELISYQEYSYPEEIINIEAGITNADAIYAPYGSKLYVKIQRDNKLKQISIEFILLEEVDEENESQN